jgi:hypothetical protein
MRCNVKGLKRFPYLALLPTFRLFGRINEAGKKAKEKKKKIDLEPVTQGKELESGINCCSDFGQPN